MITAGASQPGWSSLSFEYVGLVTRSHARKPRRVVEMASEWPCRAPLPEARTAGTSLARGWPMMNDRVAWVTFTSTLPNEAPDDPHPKGAPVAERIAQRLAEAGVTVTGTEDWRDSGYLVDCVLDGRKVYLVVSFHGDGPRQWVGMCTSDVGILDRIRGRYPTEQIRLLARAVHGVLQGDGAFANIRWYRAGWRGGGDEAWDNSP
jgi:hypothetical protein